MMKVIYSNGKYRIFGDEVTIHDTLPAGTYDINFSKTEGFYLSRHEDLVNKEEKVYGDLIKKVEKVFNSFESTNRNFGILLSGQKGIGKSMFARLLSEKAIGKGYPVLICNTPGVADFIASIKQEVVVLFDEFEKTFEVERGSQDELLSLFDGIDNGKKLFVLTCNELSRVSRYMLDRPGRIHYHFKLTSPSFNEIKEYMFDKLKPQYHSYITKICSIGAMTDLSFDMLRAIAFDLNLGYPLEDTLTDLNIGNYLNASKGKKIEVKLEDGSSFEFSTFLRFTDYELKYVTDNKGNDFEIKINWECLSINETTFVPEFNPIEEGISIVPGSLENWNLPPEGREEIFKELEKRKVISVQIKDIPVAKHNFKGMY